MKTTKLKTFLAGLIVTTISLSFLGVPAEAKTITGKTAKNAVRQSSRKDLQRKVIGYFPEWAYKSEAQGYFNATDLQWDSLTHIQYSFAMVDPSTNKLKLGDKHAALEEDFTSYDLTYKGKKIELDSTLPYKGHFNLLQTMKKQYYPNVKLLMSVGGWAGTRGFYSMIDTDEGIDTFANSCVDFIKKYNFDGIDIDFEYPSSTSQSGNPADFDLSEPRRANLNERYNILMKTLREKIDAASEKDNKDYVLSAAVTASPWVLGGVSDNTYAKYLDFLSVMSYDYHGGWNQYVENLAGIYPDPADKETASQIMPTLCMDWAYRFYRGVLPSEKIIMGIPYYTRGWENVQGGENGLHGSSKTPASGKYNIWGDDLDNDGKLEPAGANPLWHVLNLMEQDPNLKMYWDNTEKVPHVWQSKEKVFLSFENEKSIDERVKYIKDKNLGGALIWVMNGDYGLNPNYVEGSNKINEGKYTFGDTLTKRLSNDLKNIGNCNKTPDDNSNSLEPVNVKVTFDGKYDHPNYTYDLKVKNCTDKKIEGGWEVSFDLPKSALYKSSWGGTYSLKDHGDFTTVTIKSGTWQGIEPGSTVAIQGMIGLCFSGVRNITFNGMNPVGSSTIAKAKGIATDEIKEAAKETVAEESKVVNKEVVNKEVVKDESKEVVTDKSKNEVKEIAKETVSDKSKEIVKDDSKETAKEEIKEAVKETSTDDSKEAIKETATEVK